MRKLRTLPEDARGFGIESNKRRNLLNSAGSDVRRGSLGHRQTTRALSDTLCISADGTRTVIPRRKASARITPTPIAVEVGTIRTRDYAPPRHPLHVYLDYIDRFPNVLELWRARPAYSADVAVSLGAGRGW
jgi:hypothetical protein